MVKVNMKSKFTFLPDMITFISGIIEHIFIGTLVVLKIILLLLLFIIIHQNETTYIALETTLYLILTNSQIATGALF